MPLLRASLLSCVVALSGWAALAQGLPQGLIRQGDTVMMRPIPDGGPRATGESGPRPSNLRILNPSDRDLLLRAFEAARRGDWVGARGLAAQSGDRVGRDLLEWRYAMDPNSGATFPEIDAVMRAAQGWPLPGTLQARAETAMPADMNPTEITGWFRDRAPNSSIGKVRLGEALVAQNQTARGARLIREGWMTGSFDPAIELAIVQRDAAWLTPDSDRARLDALLWRAEVTAARRMIARVDDKTGAVALARIALDGGMARARPALAKLQDSSDPSLLFDWSRALRVAKRDAEAHAMLLRIPATAMTKDHAQRWWVEVTIQARDALAAGDARMALRLVQHAGFTAGEQYADQQFLSGFIALRFLKNPADALTHFHRLAAAVARPISRARARYWQGRAYEALGDNANALGQYRQAAAYPETFYGQAALAKIDAAPVLRLNESQVETAPTVELDGDLLMPQIKTLADLGEETTLRAFVERDLEMNTSPGHARRLMLSLMAWGYPEIALRIAKSQSYAGMNFPDLLFPLMALPAYKGPGTGPEPALVLALIRQETEFNQFAVSSSGAQGLMQMMPASARAAARFMGLPYRPQSVMSDADYNIQLGMAEFTGHMNRYGGSVVLSIASYNAGPTNARKWIDANGDPRNGGVDPIDWIEMIPFGETRNYVQRVLENAGAYRARLAGRDAAVRLMADLYSPGTPPAMALRAAN